MKKKVFKIALPIVLLLVIGTGVLFAFKGKNAKLEMSSIPSAATAELGEMFYIPEVTAHKGKQEVDVKVAVTDSKGGEVELSGRGTRFTATDLDGYKINFTAEFQETKVEKDLDVRVSDTKGPKISFPSDVENLMVQKGETVTVPSVSWKDKSGEVIDGGYQVMLDQEPVAVSQDTFVASEYGDYSVVYTAKDKFDNQTEEELIIACTRQIELANFDDDSKAWAQGMEITKENAVKGNSLKVACNNDYQMIAVYPTYYDLSGFDKLQITVYSDVDMDDANEGFYLLNQRYEIAKGKNIITIDKEELEEQYPEGRIPSTVSESYKDMQFLFFQIKSDTGNVWIDNLIGTFENYAADTAAPVIDLGTKAPGDVLSVMVGGKINIPEATAYDNSLEEITVSCVVLEGESNDITKQVQAGTYRVKAGKEYQIVYTASDSAGNQGKKIVEIECIDRIADAKKDQYYPKKQKYDVLQNFENGGVDFCAEGVAHSYETEHVMDGVKSASFTTDRSDAVVVMKLLKDEAPLETEDWSKYEYIQAYVYAETEGARFDFYCKMYELELGPNIITISSKDILKEIATASNVYDSTGGFYFRVTKGTVYVDSIIGVYPENYKDVPPADMKQADFFPANQKYDMLQDFENGGYAWHHNELTPESSTNHVMSGEKSLKLSCDMDWRRIVINLLKDNGRLEEEDWSKYEYIQLYAYSERNQVQFNFYGKAFVLKRGANIIRITPEEIKKEIARADEVYDATGGFLYEMTKGTIYIDSIMGVYPKGYVDVPPADMKQGDYIPKTQQYDILQDFENGGYAWHHDEITPESSAKHVMTGEKALHITSAKDWKMIVLYLLKNGMRLETEDWNKYEYIQAYVYSEKNNTQFNFYGKACVLKKGANIIRITPEQILAEINRAQNVYDVEGGFLFEMTTGDVYIDSIMGVYPQGYQEEIPADMSSSEYYPENRTYDTLQDFEDGGFAWHHDEVVPEESTNHAMKGTKSLKLTSSLDWRRIVIKLLKDGNRLEATDWNKYEYIQAYVYSETAGTQFNFYGKAFVLKKGANKIQITSAEIQAEINRETEDTVYDSEGGFLFEMTTGTVYVDSIIGVYKEGYSETTYFPANRTYDMLNDFEGSGIDYNQAKSAEYVSDHKKSGDKSLKLVIEGEWKCVVLKMLKNGSRLEENDWKKYEYIQMSVYSEKGGEQFNVWGKGYFLEKGENILKISAEDMLTQVNSDTRAYDNVGGFFFQLFEGTLYIDSIIGVYPEGV